MRFRKIWSLRCQLHMPRCWFSHKSGYRIIGKQPSNKDVWEIMKRVSVKTNIPIEILAAVCDVETGWTHFFDSGYVCHNLQACEKVFRGKTDTLPPEIGAMQICGKMAQRFNIQRLIEEVEYSVEAGARVLLHKWEWCYSKVFPKYFPNLPTGHDSWVLENWWYPVKLYNSNWEPYGRLAYPEKVFKRLQKSSPTLSSFLGSVPIQCPKEVLKNYLIPDGTNSLDSYFRVLRTGWWINGRGTAIRAKATLGSSGDKKWPH